MPSAAAMTRSSGVVMKPRTNSALAPTYTVVTVTTALSLRGYWRTFSERMAWTPATTMMRLTTMAMTGRRMKRLVKLMSPSPSAVGRRGSQLGRGSVFLHLHRLPISDLERAVAHHRLASLEPGHHGHEVAPALAGTHETLPRHEV